MNDRNEPQNDNLQIRSEVLVGWLLKQMNVIWFPHEPLTVLGDLLRRPVITVYAYCSLGSWESSLPGMAFFPYGIKSYRV